MNAQKLLVIFATHYGQAALIAKRIAGEAIASGAEATVRDVRKASDADLERCDSLVIVASVQFGRHARSVERFVKRNSDRLGSMHSAFISVSGSAARSETYDEAETIVRKFFSATGWCPDEYQLIGGAVKFKRYNPLLRFVIKRIWASKGLAMDTKRDYDFTDWDAVKRFTKAFVASETPHRAVA
ncbi:MAG TPA: flavodoxin domain-containing protein [Thermoanaerobaculia bacterium]|nr:flavodoxin domain-containing protein [Thermoanaerobaculia bacterium]